MSTHREKVWRLYGPNGPIPHKQAKRVSVHNTCWKIWAGALCLALSVSSSFAAPLPATIFTAGYVWSDTINASATQGVTSISVTASPNSTSEMCYTGGISVTSTQYAWAPFSSAGDNRTYGTSSDNVASGLVVAPDVILVVRNATISGTYWGGTTTANAVQNSTNYTIGPSGQTATNNTDSTTPWCSTYRANSLLQFGKATATSTLTATLSLYVGPLASRPSIVTVPSLWFSRAYSNTALPGAIQGPQILTATTVTLATAPTSCSVYFQHSSIPFGTNIQNPSDVIPIRGALSGLNLNCTDIWDGGSGTGTAAMTLAFSGTKGRFNTTLALQGTEGQGNLAEVRGVLATAGSNCVNNADSILFTGAPVSIGNVGKGLTTIPLTWTLCSNASDLKGDGTAQATATVTWP